MKSLTIFAFLLVVLPLLAFSSRAAIVGGYQPITDIHDHKVLEVAKFAVAEYNKESNKSLIFCRVVSAHERVVVGGIYYMMTLRAFDMCVEMTYHAIVFVTSHNVKKLVLFTPLLEDNVQEIPGVWTPIKDVIDHKMVELAKFAVAEYNKEFNKSLIFCKLVSAHELVVVGRIEYVLTLKAFDVCVEHTYKAIVLIKLVSFKQIEDNVQEIPGGWTEIKNIHDPEVQEVAKFAVAE